MIFNLATQVIRFLLLEQPRCLSWLSTFSSIDTEKSVSWEPSESQANRIVGHPSLYERTTLVSEAHLKRRRAGSPGVPQSHCLLAVGTASLREEYELGHQ